MLKDGYHDVPPGRVAAVVTHLEMRARPNRRPVPDIPSLALTRADQPDPDDYLALYKMIGRDWLWFGRLIMTEAERRALLSDPAYHIHILRRAGEPLGLLELDFRQDGECELAYFGLAPALIGSGAGRWMMDQAIDRAFHTPITRFHVHTCTNDSAAALPFYIRSGFVPVRQQIEIARDPRLTGDYDADAAPQIPIYK